MITFTFLVTLAIAVHAGNSDTESASYAREDAVHHTRNTEVSCASRLFCYRRGLSLYGMLIHDAQNQSNKLLPRSNQIVSIVFYQLRITNSNRGFSQMQLTKAQPAHAVTNATRAWTSARELFSSVGPGDEIRSPGICIDKETHCSTCKGHARVPCILQCRLDALCFTICVLPLVLKYRQVLFTNLDTPCSILVLS